MVLVDQLLSPQKQNRLPIFVLQVLHCRGLLLLIQMDGAGDVREDMDQLHVLLLNSLLNPEFVILL